VRVGALHKRGDEAPAAVVVRQVVGEQSGGFRAIAPSFAAR
jgi:hypothetical protein